MKKINYHTHTALCRHAGGDEEAYVLSAIKNNLSVLGFSDHAPFPDERFGLRMLYKELQPHIDKLSELKITYKNKLKIYSGLEIEYDRKMKAYYEELLNTKGFDYLVLGQHAYFPDNESSEAINIYFIEQSKDTSLYVDYAYSLKEGMESGFFKIAAHPDVIFINNLPWDENCEKASEIIIKAANDTGTILELNANGIRRGKNDYCDGRRYPYPHYGFWSKLSGTSIPVIINSDCHDPQQVWDECMDEAYQLAAQWNLHLVDEIGLTK